MVDQQAGGAFLDLGQGRQRDLLAVGGLDVNLPQRRRANAAGVLTLQHHAVLAGLGVNSGDLSLAEGVVECVVDIGNAHAQPPGHIAVNLQKHLQPTVLQVAGHVSQFRLLAQRTDQLGHPLFQQADIRRLHAELELRATDPVLDGQVLHRLQVQLNARNPRQLWA